MIDNFRWNFHTISKYVPISVSAPRCCLKRGTASYKCKRTLVIVVVVETLVLLTLAKKKTPGRKADFNNTLL